MRWDAHSLAGSKRGAGAGSSQAEGEAAGSGRAAGGGRASGASAAEDSTEVLGPEVPCADESAIFQEIGLAYVPPHMRIF